MRVLWFTNTPCNYQSGKSQGYNGGGWMSALQNEICKVHDIELGICFCKNNEPARIEQDGVIYYPVPHHTKARKDKITDLIYYKDPRRDEILWPHYLQHFKNAICNFMPDVIEVFGSELYTGLATIASKKLGIPCVLHIQGLLNPCQHVLLPPGVSRKAYILKDGIKGIFANFQYLTYWDRSCHREKEILKAVSHVIGRTKWDKNVAEILNPAAKYHYGGEILREEFYGPSARAYPIGKAVITTTISSATFKGFDLLLKTANILKNEMHVDFEWNCFGNVNPSFAEKITGLKHKDLNVNLLGVATASQIKEALLNSTLYFHCSYIENSPNSVGEAQLLGIPVVATNVGGTSSMVDDGKTGLLFPATDPYIGAHQIAILIKNKELNFKIGEEGKSVATQRHAREKIVDNLISIYKNVITDK